MSAKKPGGIDLVRLPPSTTVRRTYVAWKFDDGSIERIPLEDYVRLEKRMSADFAVLKERASRKQKAAHGSRNAKEEQGKVSLERVRQAFFELELRNRGRNATSLIVRTTGLKHDMVREYLKVVRAAASKEKAE